MNRIGTAVDISHVSAHTMRAALEATTAPLLASRSSAYALAPHPRNIPDDVIAGAAANKGVIMMNFYPPFLLPNLAERSLGMVDLARALMAELGDEAAIDAALHEH